MSERSMAELLRIKIVEVKLLIISYYKKWIAYYKNLTHNSF